MLKTIAEIKLKTKKKFYPQPITWGLPLPRGSVRKITHLALVHKNKIVPAQFKEVLLWPDGTIKWILLDFIALEENGYSLVLSPSSLIEPKGLQIKQLSKKWYIYNNDVLYTMDTKNFSIPQIIYNNKKFPSSSSWLIQSNNSKVYKFRPEFFFLEEEGPIKSSFLIKGQVKTNRKKKLLFWQRVHFFYRLNLIKVDFTVRNPERAKHKNGYWDLGDPGSLFFKDLSLKICFDKDFEKILVSLGKDWLKIKHQFEIYQESSGGTNWRSLNHVNRDYKIPLTFKGYRLKQDHKIFYGLRANPYIKLIGKDFSFALFFENFWQNFPKKIKLEEKELHLGLFPQEFPDIYELQGGEQKTHTFWISLSPDEKNLCDLSFVKDPAKVFIDTDYLKKTKTILYFNSYNETSSLYNELIESGINGPHSFEKKNEIIDEYGWRNFGDIYADHENIFNKEKEPIISHYNNQYDLIYGFLIQFLRSGKIEWFELAKNLARHVYDIDVYHTKKDKPAYNNGLFWHTFHYVSAYRATHRCYSKDAKITGGGPSNEHLYSSGLLLYYLLTGDPWAKETVINFAEHVLEMDQPYKILSWFDKTPSGLATQTRDPWYHGPGRGAGNSINCLLDAYILSSIQKYLTKAEEFIRRCIHPMDNIENMGLKDPESRWSYTVFLQVLGKYLFLKTENESLDFMFHYARCSLLHYARWMAKNEYIYLDKPNLLEFPTETWAAQELRKAEVFNLAAYFSESEEEREIFLKKARFFYEQGLLRLKSFPTWYFTRPLAILLQCGFSYPWFQSNMPSLFRKINFNFEEPQNFVPQKLKIKQKILKIAPVLKVLKF